MSATIQNIQALEILDSRGNPTLQVTVSLQNGCSASASVPSGASTGKREALELRDQDPKRYAGNGVLKAVAHVEQQIAPILNGLDPTDQQAIDHAMIQLDSTANKAHLGANAMLGVSLAVAKVAAKNSNTPLYRYVATQMGHTSHQHAHANKEILPVPLMNIINGGAHARNNLDVQEFMIIPKGFAEFKEALRAGTEIFHTLKKELQAEKLTTAVGDEGGFAPNLPNTQTAIELILSAITKAGYKAGTEIFLGLDCASSEFYRQQHYHLEGEALSSDQMIKRLQTWTNRYPIISIEDPMSEDDWPGWQKLTQTLGKQVQLVGDDIFVTHEKLLAQGIQQGVANAILIKPNQIGTLTETLTAIKVAQQADYGFMISHRSGETADTTIADLAVATKAGQIKTGSLCRSDRVAKYNRLLQIEHELGSDAVYAGTIKQ